MKHAKIFLPLLLAVLAAEAAEIKVDLGLAARPGAGATHFTEWRFDPAQPATNFGDITVTLRAADSATKLDGALYKGGLDVASMLTCDGVVASGGALEMVISGLAPGAHTVTTYHNSLQPPAKFVCPLETFVNGIASEQRVTPTAQVSNDHDAATAFFQVNVEKGGAVTLKFSPVGTNGIRDVTLNGFEIDTPNPKARAFSPSPADDNEHVTAAVKLNWSPAPTAVAHEIYFGTDADEVAKAGHSSPLFKGSQKSAGLPVAKLDASAKYFWRVDEVDAKKNVTRGEVWSFRPAQLAFPTAEGYGRFARGGRGGRVIEVTSLEDYDTTKGDAVVLGSFRAAVEAEGPRTIVFRVSGIIRLKRPCAVHSPYCTIAGQTAPGDGICLANFSGGAYGTHDVIIRYLRFRVGDVAQKAMDGCGLGSCDHCIIDHCSISWSSDEGTSSRGAHNITFQRSIVAEALHHGPHYRASDRTKLETHAFAGSISGDVGSYHHNLLADCTDRNWSLAGGLTQGGKYAGSLDIRNNVVYNWTARTTDGGVRALNYVNNYYKPHAPNPFVQWLLKLDKLNPAWGTESYYMTGNVLEGFVDETNNWSAFASGADVEKQVRVDAELFPSFVKTHTAREAFTNVLANVGANFPRQDAVDLHVIKDARDGTAEFTGTRGATYGDRPSANYPGIIDTQSDDKSAEGSPNFPWPEYKTYNVLADSDHDGIPDDWEKAHGLNPNDSADGSKDFNGDGYTNLEKYLNSLVGEYQPAQAAAK
jgi:hypothetical protein